MPARALQVPSEFVTKWQEIVDLLAEIICVPAALVMRLEPPNIKVLVSSKSPSNPYDQGELASLNTGLYCETVMKTRQPLFVPDALADEKWNSNPDIKLGMTSYLGFPITWPNGNIFGTICVLDNKRNDYNDLYRKLLLHCRDVLETDLRTAADLGERLQLLLNLTSRVTSSLDLREVVRAVAANRREVIHADAVGVALPDAGSGKFRVLAMDFPRGKGVFKEELVVTPGAAYKKAMDTSRGAPCAPRQPARRLSSMRNCRWLSSSAVNSASCCGFLRRPASRRNDARNHFKRPISVAPSFSESPGHHPRRVHSYRKATRGSIRAARRAGTDAARTAQPAKTTAAIPRIIGS